MRVLFLSDHSALYQTLEQESQRYPNIELCQASPLTQWLTLPDFDFALLAPLAEYAEVGREPSHAPLDFWLKNLPAFVELCEARQAGLLLLSSDQVFTREQQAVAEIDCPLAQDRLAQDVLEIEQMVQFNEHHLILRLPPLLSADPAGGLAQLITRCFEQTAPDEASYRGLVPLNDLARVILGMLLQVDAGATARGVYHYAGTEPVSQRELFHTLARLLNAPTYPADLSGTNRQGMNTQRIMNHFGIHPRAWRATLPELVEQALCRLNRVL